MKIQFEKLPKSEVKLTIKLSPQKLAVYKKKAIKELQDRVKVDGFRAGHIPADVLKQKIGEQAFMSHLMDIAISDSYEEAVKEQKVRPVAYPKINITSQDPVEYEAIVPIVPEVKWKKPLSKITVKYKKQKVEKKEIEEVLNNLKMRSTNWADVEREAKMKDRVEIDFDGFDLEGKALDGTSSKNHPLILGSNSLIPGFEEKIVGMKKDEEKTFEISFPKDYHADDFKSKKVKFTVKLNRIEEPSEPKLDDAFALEITGGNKKNMKELEEEILEELTKQKDVQEESRLEQEFLKELAKNVDADIPEALKEREKDLMIARMQEDLEKQKKSWDAYLEETKKEGKDVRKELEKPALEQVHLRLAVEKINEEEKVEVAEHEVEGELDRMFSHYPPAYGDMMRAKYEKGSQAWDMLKAQVRLRKHVSNHTEMAK
jgi:trigger factor